jgi:hypothetical protein
MQKRFALVIMVLLTGVLAMAQDVPRVETYVGYNYARINSSTDVPSFSANGGSAQFAVNVNQWLGFVADVGAVHNGNIEDIHLDTTLTNFLFGPRISIRKGRVVPFFNVLLGGVHASTSGQVNVTLPPNYPSGQPIIPGLPPGWTPGSAVTLRANASQTAFAFALGGGMDIKINKHVSFRPISLDYYMTRLQNLRSQQDKNQDHIRVGVGFNFTFGAQ